MIKMLRVDDRLIHGQVALVWSKELAVNRIVVANDSIAGDSLQIDVLKMAAPDTVKTSVVTVEKAIGLLIDPRSEALKILVVINNITDLQRITEAISEKPFIDVANVGRLEGDIADKEKLSETVYLTKDEVNICKSIIGDGHVLFYQPLPSDPKVDIKKLI